MPKQLGTPIVVELEEDLENVEVSPTKLSRELSPCPDMFGRPLRANAAGPAPWPV
ncbi:MAG: hypothetical protein IT175_12215 [Acidobacteria bacterium]|nr:hypothetical protein [Acidobacteriota bacterium]